MKKTIGNEITNTPEYLTFIDMIGLLGGASFVLLALIGFITKIWINRIRERDRGKYSRELKEVESNLNIKLDALKSKNEAKTHVGKIQYEKEYERYEDTWQLISEVNFRMRGLRHYLQLNLVSYSKIKFIEKATEFSKSKMVLQNNNAQNQPFIENDIYLNTYGVTSEIHKFYVVIDKFLDIPSPQEQDINLCITNISNSLAEFDKLIQKLSNSIRTRNNSMVVINIIQS